MCTKGRLCLLAAYLAVIVARHYLNVFSAQLVKQQQNNKRYATEIVADEAYFVDAKADGPVASFGGEAPSFQTQESARFEEVASDDDLPF